VVGWGPKKKEKITENVVLGKKPRAMGRKVRERWARLRGKHQGFAGNHPHLGVGEAITPFGETGEGVWAVRARGWGGEVRGDLERPTVTNQPVRRLGEGEKGHAEKDACGEKAKH